MTLAHFRAMGAAFALVLLGAMAQAVVGTVPSGGPGLTDSVWLNGLAGGQNFTYQYGISAAGTTQATSTQLPAGIALMEIDTVGASSGVALPPCIAGTQITIYNATATTLTIYPSIANNPLTSAQDTINSGASITLLTHTGTSPACAKNGVWGAS